MSVIADESAANDFAARNLRLLREFLDAATACRHRYPFLIAGDSEKSRAIAMTICREFFPSPLWLGDTVPAQWPGRALLPTQAMQMLGREFDAVVFDTVAGFNADALGIAGGLIRAGGLLLLLAPALDAWPHYDDPDYLRLMNRSDLLPSSRPQSPRHFLRRFCAAYLPAPRIIGGVLALPPAPGTAAPAADIIEAPYATSGQRDAVVALRQVVTGHRRRPLVLTADRGRGKSAAIGIACAQLLQQGKQHLVITAPRPSMAQTALHHACMQLPGSVHDGHVVRWRQRQLRFVAPDALLMDDAAVDAVFVDEAAALPVPILKNLLQKYSRIGFVSTIHGYEGNGRGFALRFADVLRQHSPQCRNLHVSQPVRWNDGDPLEQWINSVLCLDADINITAEAKNTERIDVREVNRDGWLANEARLRKLFALLVLAHYQTTPSDLRWLLDAPGLRLFVATLDEALVAAVVTVDEGAIDTAVHAPIIAGQRRLRGHLVAQRLAIDTGDQAWLSQRGVRVSRVVVHPEWQRHKVGTRLLQCVAQAVQADADYLSTSFGATAPLLRFWQQCGFCAMRLGFTREQASGEHAVIMVKALRDPSRELATATRQHWHEEFAFELRKQFSLLDHDQVQALMQGYAGESLQPRQLLQGLRFARGELQLASCQWALWHCVVNSVSAPCFASLDEQHRCLLIGVVLQQQPLLKVARQWNLHCRADAEFSLRRAVSILLE